MIGLGLLAVAAVHMCAVANARYVLRSNPGVTLHFENAPINDDWPQGVVVAVHGVKTGRTSYWLPWYGGTDGGRHIRGTALLDRSKDLEAQRRVERRGDLDFFFLDSRYRFLSSLPKRGSAAPAHLLIPNLDLWYFFDAAGQRDDSPRAFFDLVGCHRSTAHDRGKDAILPSVA